MVLPKKSTCLLVTLLFFLMSFAVFGSSLSHEFVTWDDYGLVVDNEDIREISLASFKAVFSRYDPELYIPLTFVSYQISYALGGLDPSIYIVANIVLHTLNALLISMILWLMIGEPILAIFLGLIFLVHPLNVEAVMWASARKDVLSAFFYLAALLSYLQYRTNEVKRFLTLSIAAFFLGLLSKVMIITLPAVLLFLDLYERRTDYRKMLLEKVPYISLAIIFGIVSLFGKASILASTTLVQKVLMSGLSSFFYLYKFIVPTGLSVMYPYNGIIDISYAYFYLPVIFGIPLAYFLFRERRKKPWLVLGFAIYFVTLAPTFINFAKGGDVYIASDRYAYLPMIGLLFLIGSLLSEAGARLHTSRSRFVMAGVIVLFGFLSFEQSKTWATSSTLYEQVLSQYPKARAALNNLGMEHLRQGNFNEALRYFDMSIAVKNDPKAHINKAAAFEAAGDTASALKEYKWVMSIDPEIPDAYYGIANVASKQGQLRESAIFYRKAIDLKPDFTNAINNLGAVYLQLQEWDLAIEMFQLAISFHPTFSESYYNLGGAFEAKGNLLEAKKAYVSALQYSPDDIDAITRLASIFLKEGKTAEVEALIKKGLAIEPDNKDLLEIAKKLPK